MVHEEPKCVDTARFKAADAARMLGIHRNTLRLHTIAGHIHCVFTRQSNRPYYTGSEIKRYWRTYI